MLLASDRVRHAGRRTGAASGILWASSLLWKQNTALFAPVYMRLRRWRALALASAIVVAASLPYFLRDPSAWEAFSANWAPSPPAPQLGDLGVRQWLYSLSFSVAPGLRPEARLWVGRIWVGLVLAAGLWATWRIRPSSERLGLCLWMTTFFLVYPQVWEHHYVMLLPVYVVLLDGSGPRWLWLLYALTACWTPYRLVDPQGMAAYHIPMRWTSLSPRILDVVYHGSKALPTVVLWGHLVRLVSCSPQAEEGP
jgi:hypothetical protein